MTEDLNHHFLHMTAETLGRSLLEGLIQEIRIMPDHWMKLSQAKQNDVIERLQKQITTAVGKAVYMIAAAERKTAYGKLESVAIKDKMKAVLVINPHSPCKHDLMDAVEQDCLLILGGAEEYLQGLDQVEGDPDQPPLDLNGGDQDMSEDGAWDHGSDEDLVDAEFYEAPALPGVEKFGGHTYGEVARWVAVGQIRLDAGKLQSRFAIELEQAQRLLIMLLDDGVIELEVEDEDDATQNLYRVVKKLTDLDINME